jgi:hypothetical protein
MPFRTGAVIASTIAKRMEITLRARQFSQLHPLLTEPQDREEAIGILRGLIEKISVRPTGKGSYLPGRTRGRDCKHGRALSWAQNAQKEPVKVVAGEGYRHYRATVAIAC